MSEKLHPRHHYEPRPVEQDQDGCEVAVLTNVAAILDGDLSSFDAVCEQIGRLPGEPITAVQKLHWAIELKGYDVKHICAFDSGRLATEGAEYISQYFQRYPSMSEPSMLPYLRMQAEQNLEQTLATAKDLDTYLEPFKQSGAYNDELRSPGYNDIDEALADQSVVQLDIMCPFRHAVLIYGKDQTTDKYKMFFPRYEYSDEQPAFMLVSTAKLDRLDGIDSITVYSKRR